MAKESREFNFLSISPRISSAARGLVRIPRPGLGHIALGLAIAAMGIYVAEADDAPGVAVIGMLLMAVKVVLGVTAARNRLPIWARSGPCLGRRLSDVPMI